MLTNLPPTSKRRRMGAWLQSKWTMTEKLKTILKLQKEDETLPETGTEAEADAEAEAERQKANVIQREEAQFMQLASKELSSDHPQAAAQSARDLLVHKIQSSRRLLIVNNSSRNFSSTTMEATTTSFSVASPRSSSGSHHPGGNNNTNRKSNRKSHISVRVSDRTSGLISLVDLDFVDVEEQARLLEMATSQKQQKDDEALAMDLQDELEAEDFCASVLDIQQHPLVESQEEELQQQQKQNNNNQQQEQQMIEVSPGVSLPLIPASQTWQDFLNGQFSVTVCWSCDRELTCSETADLVVCSGCWAFSPVDKQQQLQEGEGGLTSCQEQDNEEDDDNDNNNNNNNNDNDKNDNDEAAVVSQVALGIHAEQLLELLQRQTEGSAAVVS